MYKSFVVSIAVIMFVNSIISRDLAQAEALQCIALFDGEKIAILNDQSKKSNGASTSPILMTLNERLSAMALNLFEGNIDPVLNAQLFKAQIDHIDQLIQLLETGKLFR